jgi:hypothetical protein
MALPVKSDRPGGLISSQTRLLTVLLRFLFKPAKTSQQLTSLPVWQKVTPYCDQISFASC